MYKKYKDDLFDSLLALALYETSLSESENYPEDEIEKITLSEECDTKIRKMGRRVKYTRFLKSSARSVSKVVAGIAVVMGISFCTLLLNSEVRAACYSAIVTFYEKYVEILIHPSAQDEKPEITVGYIPEGYKLTDSDNNEYMSTLIFYNDAGHRLFIQHSQISTNLQADMEHYQIRDIVIHTYPGKLFLTSDPDFTNMLVWYKDEDTYTIIADLPEDVLIKIAKNLK